MPASVPDFAYPPAVRLRRDEEFKRVLQRGLIHPGREILVRILPNELGHARLGIGSPRRYGNAIRRNRFRRLVRDVFRHIRDELDGLDVLVTPRKGLVTPTREGITRDFRAAPDAARPARPYKRRGRDSKARRS